MHPRHAIVTSARAFQAPEADTGVPRRYEATRYIHGIAGTGFGPEELVAVPASPQTMLISTDGSKRTAFAAIVAGGCRARVGADSVDRGARGRRRASRPIGVKACRGGSIVVAGNRRLPKYLDFAEYMPSICNRQILAMYLSKAASDKYFKRMLSRRSSLTSQRRQ